MTRIVAISDTHGLHLQLPALPDGDVLIHTGDFCAHGDMVDCIKFFNWFNTKPHKHKIVIAGNHDIFMDVNYLNGGGNQSAIDMLIPEGVTYLNDSGCEVEGIKFWGSPIQPTFFNWAFNRERGEDIQQHWDLIPEDTDVLLTHGPCFGILDESVEYINFRLRIVRNARVHVGCKDLRNAIDRIKPSLHICGHIHGAYGDYYNLGTTFVNASVCNEEYILVNKPYVVDINGKSVTIVKNNEP